MTTQAFILQLKQAISGDVYDDPHTLGIYSTDASVYQILPKVVVLPKNDEDVKTAIRLAREHKVSILPRGGGTSLAGQTVGNSMILDFSKYMNALLELNIEEQWAWVQPGLVRDVLNDSLAQHQLHFAPDPATSSRANIGGMIGNNSSGTKSILYGKTVDHVLEAKFLLADGTLLHLKKESQKNYQQVVEKGGRQGKLFGAIQHLITTHKDEIEERFPKVMRRVGGYNLDEFIDTDDWNLAKLIVGSEGTLGILLCAKINLTPLPKEKSVCVVHFHEVLEAIRAVGPMLAFQPAAIEILDDTVVKLSRENLETRRHAQFIEGDPAAILIVEFYGDSKEDILARPQKMIATLQGLDLGYAWPLFTDKKGHFDVWHIRKKGLGLMLGIKGKKKPLAFIEDAGIPTEVLPEYIEKVLNICKELETEVAMYAHASVGVIHVRPILDLRDPVDIDRFHKISERTFELVQHYGGSWSGEHGDGLVRSPLNEAFFGEKLYAAFKQLKQLFDPDGLMNPGKIVDAPAMIENLRYGADYEVETPKTYFHYRTEQGFEAAVDMCTGVGECRKLIGGTMCPSFHATRDEEHSTRGRANALRMAMSGQIADEDLASPRLQKAMDLCLSCKGCKSECPSNVDMAKLKGDVRQQYYDKHGIGLRDRFIRSSTTVAERVSGSFAPFVNLVQKTGLFRWGLEKIAGFDRRRTLPPYTRRPFEKWYREQRSVVASDRPKVALFADTYLNYHEPQIGEAAYKLLTDCGYEVILAKKGCCQRPKISHGFLKEAKEAGTRTLEGLDTFFDLGIPVLVCEPSCASAIVDDLADLIDDEHLAKRIQKNVFMIDVFLAREKREGRLLAEFSAKSPDILLHGHCHQKALFGTQSMKILLGEHIKEIASGCCGMAGSFGYEKEHYELSRKIGEPRLLSVIDQAQSHTEVIACGFSCRHQIEHFTNKRAKHWVEMVEVRA